MTQPQSAQWLRIGRLSRTGKRQVCRLYRIWESMKSRCLRPYHNSYKLYGARGITICPEWLDYANFRKWAIENGYQDGLSIDRLDPNGDYEPDNCRWATDREQIWKARCTRQIEYCGETRPLPEWAQLFGMTADQLRARLHAGWDMERALTQPLQSYSRKHRSRVSHEQARWARECGLRSQEIADRLGVSISYARRIARGDILREAKDS